MSSIFGGQIGPVPSLEAVGLTLKGLRVTKEVSVATAGNRKRRCQLSDSRCVCVCLFRVSLCKEDSPSLFA